MVIWVTTWVELSLSYISVGKNEAALRAMTVALNLAPHDRHAARCLAGG